MLQWTLGAVPVSNYDFLWIYSREWDCWILWWYYFFVLFSWSISDLQCCVSFRCITKWLSYTYTCIPSFSDSFLIQFITEYWVEFSLLYSRSFLDISSIYSCVCGLPGWCNGKESTCQWRRHKRSMFPDREDPLE